jgi:hypothetical protein
MIVTQGLSGTYNRTWDITFPLSSGAPSLLSLNATLITGTDLVASVTRVTNGSALLSGSYTVTLMGITTTLSVNDSADSIQTTLQSTLPTLQGRVLLIDDLSTGIENAIYRITFPISMGLVSSIIIDSSLTKGGLVLSSVKNETLGTYESLEGTFSLTVEGETSSSLRYNASKSDIKGALKSLSTVSLVSIQRYEGLIDVSGYLYKGLECNISFDAMNSVNYGSALDIAIGSNNITGYAMDNIATIQEVQARLGPMVPVEISFDGQFYTDSGIMYELLEPIVLLSLFPVVGPYIGGTTLTVQFETILHTQAPLSMYDVKCVFNNVVVTARFLTKSTLECITPRYPLLSGNTVLVGVTLDGQNIAKGLSYTYQPAVSNLIMLPSCGPYTGGTQISIAGTEIS